MTDPAPPPTKAGEHPATNGEVRRYFRWVSAQNITVLLAVVGALGLGGKHLLRWMVGDAVAQDAGFVVLRSEFETHKKEESNERDRTRSDTQLMRVELHDARRELKALYEWQKTGSPAAARVLEAPLPPPPVPTPAKDGGR